MRLDLRLWESVIQDWHHLCYARCRGRNPHERPSASKRSRGSHILNATAGGKFFPTCGFLPTGETINAIEMRRRLLLFYETGSP